MRRLSRRGQVALFVAIGLVILIAVLLATYLLRSRLFGEQAMETLPADFEPVQQHVQACLRDTTVEALKTMATHGGYLDVRDTKWTGTPLLTNPFDPTESDTVLLNVGDNESGVPYYYYLKSRNTCTDCLLSTLTPSVEHMESQARAYVLQHLYECVNYGSFPDLQVTADPKQDLTITILNDSVLIRYERTLDLTKGSTTVRASVFTQEVNYPYGRVYNVAKTITQREIDTQFLENYLMYLVAAYGGVGLPLPPIAGYDESFSPSFWILANVQRDYQQLIASTTPTLQVARTSGVIVPPPTGDAYLDAYFKMTTLDLFANTSVSPSRYRVSFYNPNQPMYLNIQPRKGQLIKPRQERSSGVLFIPPRQQNYYDFFYDASVPFIVEIREENAMPGEDLSFVFALEANVRENKNMVRWLAGRGTIPWSEDFVSYVVTDPSTQPGATNETNGTRQWPLYPHNASIKSLFCNQAAWTTPFTVKTRDARTNKPLDDVSFTYSCGKYGGCGVGASLLGESNRSATLQALLPKCTGGLLKAEKEGYTAATTEISTRGVPIRAPDIDLEPYIPVRIRIETLKVAKNLLTDVETLGSPEPLSGNTSVFVTMSRKQFGRFDPLIAATAVFDPSSTMDEVRLIPGQYEVRAMYLDNNGFVIPKRCKKIEGAYIPENDTEVKPAPLGGSELTNETRLFSVERNQLSTARTLVIPIFIAPTPTCIDDLENMGETKRYTRMWIQQAMPRFE